jgi:hypothetical protein
MAATYRTSQKDFYIVLAVIAVIFVGTVAGILNLFKKQGAGPQPTSL